MLLSYCLSSPHTRKRTVIRPVRPRRQVNGRGKLRGRPSVVVPAAACLAPLSSVGAVALPWTGPQGTPGRPQQPKESKQWPLLPPGFSAFGSGVTLQIPCGMHGRPVICMLRSTDQLSQMVYLDAVILFFLLRQEVGVQDSQVAEAAPVAAPRSLAVAGDGAPGNARAVQAVQPAQVVRAGGGPRAAGSLRAPAASQARLTCSSSRPSGPGHAGHPVRASPPLDASVAGGDARGAEASRSTLLEQASFTSGASSTAPYIDIELWHVRRFFVYLDAALRHGLRLIVRYSGLRGD